LTIAGQPALSAAIPGLPVGSPDSSQTLYGVWTFDHTNAVKFYSMMPTKNFTNVRPTIEALVRSYIPAR
jgi:DICT domain-containing protein